MQRHGKDRNLICNNEIKKPKQRSHDIVPLQADLHTISMSRFCGPCGPMDAVANAMQCQIIHTDLDAS
jgi:hypothetical protein